MPHSKRPLRGACLAHAGQFKIRAALPGCSASLRRFRAAAAQCAASVRGNLKAVRRIRRSVHPHAAASICGLAAGGEKTKCPPAPQREKIRISVYQRAACLSSVSLRMAKNFARLLKKGTKPAPLRETPSAAPPGITPGSRRTRRAFIAKSSRARPGGTPPWMSLSAACQFASRCIRPVPFRRGRGVSRLCRRRTAQIRGNA